MKYVVAIFLLWGISCHTKALDVVFPDNLPPWVIDDTRGMALDIVRIAMDQAGYEFKPIFSPLPRLAWMLEQPEVDAVAMVELPDLADVFYSLPLGEFETVIVTLQKNKVRLRNVAYLENIVVSAFKGASQVFPALSGVAERNNLYQELVDQQGQVSMLFMQRTDAIILDKSVFLYWASRGVGEAFRQPVDIVPLHDIIPAAQKNQVYVVFKDEKVRNSFNVALSDMQTNGKFGQVIAEYLGR